MEPLKNLEHIFDGRNPGETIFLHGPRSLCDRYFERLCITRRDDIGALPRSGGLIPELRMLDQIALPMRLAGAGESAIMERIRALSPAATPLHRLYDPPVRSNPRIRAWAAILRALIRQPKLIVINGFFEELEDADALWQMLLSARGEDSVLIYLSSMPAPEQVGWTQQLRIQQGRPT